MLDNAPQDHNRHSDVSTYLNLVPLRTVCSQASQLICSQAQCILVQAPQALGTQGWGVLYDYCDYTCRKTNMDDNNMEIIMGISMD